MISNSRHRTIFISLLTFLLCGLTAENKVVAQALFQDTPRYDFVYRNWNNQSGLPQNSVFSLVHDSTGYLWGSTEEGLFRFDGAQFKVINEANTPGLHSNIFYHMFVDGADLWASSRNSIIRIREEVEQIIDFSRHTIGGWITTIEQDGNGAVWAGTSNGKLYFLVEDSIYACSNWTQANSGAIEAMKFAGGQMYIGTSHGLFAMRSTNSRETEISQFAGMSITRLEKGSGNDLWIGTATNGLFRYNAETNSITEMTGLKENYINSLYYDTHERLWIGYRSEGYQVFDGQDFTTPGQDEYAHDGIRAILVTETHAWLGTNSSGLVQVKPAQILSSPAELQLNGKIILPIYQHGEGDIWVGTAGMGVHRYVNGKLHRYNQKNGLSNDLVLSISGTPQYVYIGTSNGLNRFNRKTQSIDKLFTRKNGLVNDGILGLFTDSKNRVWITTRLGGLQRINQAGELETIKLPEAIANSNLISICEDRRGNILFGTRGGGILIIDGKGSISMHQRSNGFPADIVYSFYEDDEGDIWMGTEKGLVVHHEDNYVVFTKASGLMFDGVYRMLPDSKGFLWMSGNVGLQRVALADLKNAKKSGIENFQINARLFNSVDGMPNSETNGGIFPAGWKMQNGQLWFPTAGGVAVVDADLVTEYSDNLGIHIQSLRYGGMDYFQDDRIQLPPGVYNFEIRYTSIDFGKPSEIRFYYRLRGLSNQWTSAGTRRIAYFSGLAPGEYIFEVRAERYGTKSETVSMSFTIKPQFYQTIWFKILLTLALILLAARILWSIRNLARRKLQEQQRITMAQINGQERERQLISAELHDSINQQLSTARMYLDVASTSDENLRLELIDKSKDVLKHTISEISALCHSLTPPSLKDIGLLEAIDELLDAYRAMGRFKIHTDFSIDAESIEEELQFTMFRITQEQMNNIAQHAEASNVWIKYYTESDGIHVTIRDDGKGFDPRTVTYGMGFENIRNRLSLFEGRLDIKTAPGKGCGLEVFIPRG